MKEPLDNIPSRNEPDPLNIRQNSFQGGADGLPNPPPPGQTYADIKRMQGAGKLSTTNSKDLPDKADRYTKGEA